MRHRLPRDRRAGARAAAALAAVCLALAGCGGDDDGEQRAAGDVTAEGTAAQPADGGSGEVAPPGEITTEEADLSTEDVLRPARAVLTGTDPCGDQVTTNYLRTAYGGRDGCLRAQGPAATASGITFISIEIMESEATAIVTPEGGPSDGQRVTVGLVLENGTWKVDSLRSDVPVGP